VRLIFTQESLYITEEGSIHSRNVWKYTLSFHTQGGLLLFLSFMHGHQRQALQAFTTFLFYLIYSKSYVLLYFTFVIFNPLIWDWITCDL